MFFQIEVNATISGQRIEPVLVTDSLYYARAAAATSLAVAPEGGH